MIGRGSPLTTPEHYRAYKKMMLRSHLGDSAHSPEYRILSQAFPFLSESIRLEGEKKRLKAMASENEAAKLRRKRRIHTIDMELRRLDLRKRLHGESGVEARFKRRLVRERSRERASSIYGALRKRAAYLRSCPVLRRRLPPTTFDLTSLAIREKGMRVREWVARPREDDPIR
jgi:hypothetical protein